MSESGMEGQISLARAWPRGAPSWRRPAAVAVLALLLAMCAGLLATGAGEARPHPPQERTRRFVVQLSRPSLALYGGDVQGISAPPRDGRGKLRLGSLAARAYLALLDRDHLAFRLALARTLPSAKIQWSYRIVFNGVALRAPVGALSALRRIRGVRAVWSTDRRVFLPVMDVSLPLIGAPAYWDAAGGVGLAGLGQKVAVIDTGIDVDNPMFDPGSASYPAGFPKGAIAYTTPKVISARAYFRPDDPVDTDRDTPTPEDHLGHGSHVAGTIAGVEGTVFDLGGYQTQVSGVAPHALLMSYKVFYRAESGMEGASEPELMAAFEDAVSDGADVISNSWGGPDIFGEADPSLEAYEGAVAAGCVVVFAAGNDGPGEGSMGSPGSHSTFITVGSVSTGRRFQRYLEVTGPLPVDPELQEVSMSVGYISAPFSSDLGPAPLRSSHLVDGGGNEEACAPFSPGAFDGAIALVLRGSCTFTEKVDNAADASALAVIVQNNDPQGGHFPMTGDDALAPAVMVAYDDGQLLRAWVETWPTAEVVLRTGYVPYFVEDEVDRVVYSSSRGPTAQAVLKPDIAAPGSLILSADAHRVGSSSTRQWAWKSGTSMATPHVAGAAALLKQAHPSWTHHEIKAALVGRATREGVTSWIDGPGGQPWELGSGRLALDRLVDIRLLATPAVVSFGEGEAGETVSARVSLARVAGDVSSVTPMWRSDAPLVGMLVDPPHGAPLSLDPDGALELELSVTIPQDAPPGEHSGWIDLEDDGGGLTTLPFHFRVVPGEPDRDLLIVDMQFSSENGTEDYSPYYTGAADALGLTWSLAQVGEYSAAPSVPEMMGFRVVLVITGDDQWNHFGYVGRGTLDRLSAYMLRGGRVILAGQGPLRSTRHSRIQAMCGAGTLDERPLYDDSTGGLFQLPSYTVKAIDFPLLVTGDVDLTPGAGAGDLSRVAELLIVSGTDFDYGLDAWTTPVLKMAQGGFSGPGYVGMAYDPFRDYGVDRLAEAHDHRALLLGFGLELINEPADASQIGPGSRAELLSRAFAWVADRVSLGVDVHRSERAVTLEVSASSSTSSMASFWADFGDGSEPMETTEPELAHEYDRFGQFEVTLVARSGTGAAALWRHVLSVQPGSDELDAGVADASTIPDADATIIEGSRRGCGGCEASAGSGGGALFSLLVLLWVAFRRRRP